MAQFIPSYHVDEQEQHHKYAQPLHTLFDAPERILTISQSLVDEPFVTILGSHEIEIP